MSLICMRLVEVVEITVVEHLDADDRPGLVPLPVRPSAASSVFFLIAAASASPVRFSVPALIFAVTSSTRLRDEDRVTLCRDLAGPAVRVKAGLDQILLRRRSRNQGVKTAVMIGQDQARPARRIPPCSRCSAE